MQKIVLGICAAIVIFVAIPLGASADHLDRTLPVVPLCDIEYGVDQDGDRDFDRDDRIIYGDYGREHNCCFPEAVPNDVQGGCGTRSFFQFLRNIINFLTLRLAPILVAIFIVVGGFVIMTSTGNAEKYNKGKRMITISLIGMAIALVAFLIVNAIFTALTGSSFGDFDF